MTVLYTDRVNISTSPPARTFVGQRFELRCSPEDPDTDVTSITWSRDSGLLNSTKDMGAEVLTIDYVRGGDAGIYTCNITYDNSTLTKTYELIKSFSR